MTTSNSLYFIAGILFTLAGVRLYTMMGAPGILVLLLGSVLWGFLVYMLKHDKQPSKHRPSKEWWA